MAAIPRNGIPKNLTLDPDAVVLLGLLNQGHKGQGRLVSELIRAEVVRREERATYVAEGKLPWICEDQKL